MSQYRYTVKTAQLLGARERQEDTVSASSSELFVQRGMLLVLADGMGGMANGHLFSQLVSEQMQQTFCILDPMTEMSRMLWQCFEMTQQRAAAMNEHAEEEGGTTLVAVLIRDGRCTFLSVGDSRLALIRNGGLIWLNRPQVMSIRLDENVALGYLRQEDVQGSALRDALTTFVGSSTAVSCDVCTESFSLVPGDRIALMSDGITGTLDERTLLSLLMMPKESATDAIIQAVKLKNKPEQDNASIVLVVVDS